MRVNFDGLRKSIVAEFNAVARIVNGNVDDGEVRLYKDDAQRLGKALNDLRTELVWLVNLMHECDDKESSYGFLDDQYAKLVEITFLGDSE